MLIVSTAAFIAKFVHDALIYLARLESQLRITPRSTTCSNNDQASLLSRRILASLHGLSSNTRATPTNTHACDNMDSPHALIPAPPPSPNVDSPELGPLLSIPASTSTFFQNEEAGTSASGGPPSSTDGTQNGWQQGAQPFGMTLAGPSRPAAPAPGGPRQKLKPRIRHAMRRASFDLSPNPASTPGPSAPATSKLRFED